MTNRKFQKGSAPTQIDAKSKAGVQGPSAAPLDLQTIPLNKLVLSPRNVRKTPVGAEADAELMDMFRAREVSLDCIMALTLTDDYAREIKVWETVKQQNNQSAQNIRHQVTQKSYLGASKLAKFVGINAYKKVGGRMSGYRSEIPRVRIALWAVCV
jgi:hypothetical protein